MTALEHYFDCPYCGESISILIDTKVERQEYIEDCEVCCRPINLVMVSDGDTLHSFEATADD